MSHILALETATDICEVAVLTDDNLIAKRSVKRARSHAENLAPMISECLVESDYLLRELDAIAVSSGPGSYTGLRIGVSTAKGLSYASDVPIISVPTLEALASPILRASPDPVVVTLLSRTDEVYLGVFKNSGGETVRLVEEKAISVFDVMTCLSDSGVVSGSICGPGLRRLLENQIDISAFETVDGDLSAESVGFIAFKMFDRQLFEDTSAFEPYYLRDFEARKSSTSVFDRLPF